MSLKIWLKVKFRAFGVTFGTLEQEFDPIALPIPAVVPSQVLVDFNQRGVKLFVKLVPAA